MNLKDMICGKQVDLPSYLFSSKTEPTSVEIQPLSLKPDFNIKLQSKGLGGKEFVFKPKINYTIDGFVDIDKMRSAFVETSQNS